ncbi:MAG: Nudix family hydrolase [Xanthomonadaceae bacterium]|jgi:8-oxo-dGTP diphosphatase|nr:Nudix family hydrolase [Xanthomonadaceae bacterium]
MSDESIRFIHVVAGVITDARDRILLARRTVGRELAGLWEFPGGKREPGETSEAALMRELHEELGIDVEVGECLIEVPQRYPDKRLRLEVRRINHWRQRPRGREGQALTWVAVDKLTRYAMPLADYPVVAALRQPDCYLVTPEPDGDGAAWLQGLVTALEAGVRRVQLRARNFPSSRWPALVHAAVSRCREAGAEVLLNRDIELAKELGIGVHLGSEQLERLRARPLPEPQLVAASCHTETDLRMAQLLGCTFAVLGPLRETASHPVAIVPPLGWDRFSLLRETASLPIYAIGGLTTADIRTARVNGAQGIAAIRGLWSPSPISGTGE